MVDVKKKIIAIASFVVLFGSGIASGAEYWEQREREELQEAIGRASETGDYAALDRYLQAQTRLSKEERLVLAMQLALEREDLRKVKMLVEQEKFDIKSIVTDGLTALQLAILNNSKESNAIARYLVNKGADVNTVDKLGRNALMLAAQKGNKELVQAFVPHIKNLKHTDSKKHDALWHATAFDTSSPAAAQVIKDEMKKRGIRSS